MTRARVLLISAIGFGMLYLAAVIAIGTPPEANDSGREVARWFRDHDSNARAAVWLITLAGPLAPVDTAAPSPKYGNSADVRWPTRSYLRFTPTDRRRSQ